MPHGIAAVTELYSATGHGSAGCPFVRTLPLSTLREARSAASVRLQSGRLARLRCTVEAALHSCKTSKPIGELLTLVGPET
jgi:hypothetical protein